MAMIRPRRSMLFVPGANARALEKARDIPADAFILDLEDSVAPSAKELARRQVGEQVARRNFGRREIIVRVNGLDSHGWLDDLSMVAKMRPDGVLIPKVAAPADIAAVAARLGEAGGEGVIAIWAMIERPLAVLNVGGIAAHAAADRRFAGLVVGPNDLSRETGARMVPGRGPMLPWLSACVLAARAHGVDVIDGAYNNFKDTDGFARECAQARDMGFDGKSLIHPAQVEICNAAFAPDADEVARARRVVAAFAEPDNADMGVIQIDGEMVERLHLDIARRTVAMAEAIARDPAART